MPYAGLGFPSAQANVPQNTFQLQKVAHLNLKLENFLVNDPPRDELVYLTGFEHGEDIRGR